MTEIILHTSGACEAQTRGIGGWAAILNCGTHHKSLGGSEANTGSDTMELTAAINGLSALKQPDQTVTLMTTLPYLASGINEDMKPKSTANRTLWQRMHELLARHQVTAVLVSPEDNEEATAHARAQIAVHRKNPVTPKSVTTTTHLMIAGSREATEPMLDYARRAVRSAHERGYTVFVGDNHQGVDMAVVRTCRRLRVPVIVAGPGNFPRNGGCKHGQYVKVDRETYSAANGRMLNRYTVRDRWLADNAHIGLFIWNGDSPGTKYGYNYMADKGKDTHLIDFSAKVER